jgi:NADPH:quinone reductase
LICCITAVLTRIVYPFSQKQRDHGFYVNSFPAILIADIAGEVVEIGRDVKKFEKGDIVIGQLDMLLPSNDAGGFQQYTILDEIHAFKVPQGLTADEASTLVTNFITSLVALFAESGLGLDKPDAKGSQSSYANQTLVVLGGNSDTGRFGLQLARLAGFGKIIAVASANSTGILKSLGATHVIDRHLEETDISRQIQEIAGSDGVKYVYNTFDSKVEFAVSILSEKEKGVVATIVPPAPVDEAKAGKKSDTYEVKMVPGFLSLAPTICAWYNDSIASWVREGVIKPCPYKVIDGGLNADGLNNLLDQYKDGKNPGRHHLHPNGEW